MTGTRADQSSQAPPAADLAGPLHNHRQSTSDLLDLKGAAAHLGVPESYIRRLVLERRVAYHKVGRYLRFKPADLDHLVDRGRVEPSDAPLIPRQVRNPRLFTTTPRPRRNNEGVLTES